LRLAIRELQPIYAVIYDPTRRAQQLRHRILESMTAEEIEAYAQSHAEPAPSGDDTDNGTAAEPRTD
jgi:hypothetical protein